jgi:hypothetical protein
VTLSLAEAAPPRFGFTRQGRFSRAALQSYPSFRTHLHDNQYKAQISFVWRFGYATMNVANQAESCLAS